MPSRVRKEKYDKRRVKCEAQGCSTVYVKGRHGVYCSKHRKRRPEYVEEDNIPGYVRLADMPAPRWDPWSQRGDYEGFGV